ncbi:MAG: hypothetical protein QOH60_847 [Mycobacterium sp.]|jgi:hypothetical protein|nr:hypothetical protein [Mycobacterium sp.]
MSHKKFLGTSVISSAIAAAALTLASPASAQILDRRIAVDCPQPFSQECMADGKVAVPANGDLFIEFRGDPKACADIIGHISVNGVEFGSGQTGPGRNNFAFYVNGADVPSWPDNQYHIAMRADGVPGGCNTGAMSGWAGILHIETGSDA